MIIAFAAGQKSKCWMASIDYEWDEKKGVFNVQTETAIKTGGVYNYTFSTEEVKSSEEIDEIIHNMKKLENHYKKVYA